MVAESRRPACPSQPPHSAANNAGSQAPRISVLAKCHCDGLVSCECACVAAVSGSVNIKRVLDFDDPGVPPVMGHKSAKCLHHFFIPSSVYL